MRCDDGIYGSLFSHIDLYIDLEKRVRVDHPLRVIRQIANAALKLLSGEFAKLYSPIGRESVPPERLMHASRSGNCSSCFAGSASRTRCGRHELHRETTGCWMARWWATFSRRCCRKTRSKDCCRAITSRLMARCWKRRRARRTSRKGCLGRAAGPRGATPNATSTASAGRMRRTPRPPTPTPVSSARARAKKRGCVSWATR
jgi:hypothetical protein